MSTLTRYFTGTAWKYLSAVDATAADRSNQHEIGSNKFTRILGNPGTGTLRLNAVFVYFGKDDEEVLQAEGEVSFYDTRRNNRNRGPEYRLYYRQNTVTLLMAEGDFCLVAARPDKSLLVLVTPPGNAVERRVRYLFGLPNVEGNWQVTSEINPSELDLASQTILEAIGIELEDSADDLLGRLIDAFGLKFPATRIFSNFARQNSPTNIDAVKDADAALESWMKFEERLFRTLEREIVQARLTSGFNDVDDFVMFSLSVQNRRKARVGQALENHLEAVFIANRVSYSRGCVTEGQARPDFVFPGCSYYHDPRHVAPPLRMLAAKSTCKDRWRQILPEAGKIPVKHLFTLETAISQNQTDEMRAHQVQLVVPPSVARTYSAGQQEFVMCLSQFLSLVR
jgi:predicted nucleic acid-binding Zn finger protein